MSLVSQVWSNASKKARLIVQSSFEAAVMDLSWGAPPSSSNSSLSAAHSGNEAVLAACSLDGTVTLITHMAFLAGPITPSQVDASGLTPPYL